MLAMCFDTETSGLVENMTIKDDKRPEIIEFYGVLVDLETATQIREVDVLVKPKKELSATPPWGSKKTISEITGITNEMLSNALPFSELADEIIGLIECSPVVIAHNCSFDVDMLDIEAARCGKTIKWPRRLCTVEQTAHLKGKRLKLNDLHEFLFGQKFEEAHRAKNDVQAMVRCCVELLKRGEL